MPPDALVLGFDTSAAHCAAALISGDRVVASRFEEMAKGQAERLMVLLEELLTEAGTSWSDLTALGVGIGPGNFTGIRISVAAARGLSLGLGIPAVGVSTLEAQAEGLSRPVVSLCDGRRGAFYVQSFGTSPSGPALADGEDILRKHKGACFVGHRADELSGKAGGSALVPAYPLAVAIARLADRRRGGSVDRPAPLYLREADAAPSRDAPPVILP